MCGERFAQLPEGHILDFGMATSVSGFYDDFAGDYHLLFENWEGSMQRQAAAVGGQKMFERVSSRRETNRTAKSLNWIWLAGTPRHSPPISTGG